MGTKASKKPNGAGAAKRSAPRSRAKARPQASAAPAGIRPKTSPPHFPVVGIGASAGGLQALRRFFGQVPEHPGSAFVVVQHLDPQRKSETAELLRRDSRLPVVQVSDKQRVETDRVYVIPPNRELSIRDGVLHLTEPSAQRGFRTPVDGFLRSLAEDQEERAVAVILSGTGADGALGVKAVKAAGGMTMAQDPDTAEYDGMPRSAVATGVVDFALPVEDLPAVLLRYVRHPYLRKDDGGPSLFEGGADHYQAILALLRARTKYDFSPYKSGTIWRRIERRMGLKHLHRVPDYLKYLQDHPAEVQALFRDLLISVTRFFREPRAWELLERDVIPKLIKRRPLEDTIRLWVPGCATGEEAYTLAMLMAEGIEASKKSRNVQVFASDLDASALEFARAGVYSASVAADISAERLRRFFVKTGGTYRINKQIREMVVFAVQNLISDPPFSRIDLISCRNLMIYLAPAVHRRVISLFHFALRPDGYLLLGNAESVGTQADLFEAVSKKWRIYRRIGQQRHAAIEFPIAPATPTDTPKDRGASMAPARENRSLTVAQSVMLERYVPAAALVSAKQEILYLFGDTQRFLLQPTGQLTADLLTWSRGSIRSKVRSVLRQAMEGKRRATVSVLNVADDKTPRVRITVDPLVVPKEVEGCFLVVFEDDPVAPTAGSGPAAELGDETALRQLEYELSVLREQLRTTGEQFESSNQELKSSNEEMTSMNEELQSANEELETSKEELQSLNEELATVNAQLEAKVQELEATTNDLQNLLASTNIATLFLDRQFHIRRFTPAMTELLSLVPTDVKRPIGDFAQKFTDRQLIPDAQDVLLHLQPKEAEVRTDAGRWYLRRILPYRTEDDRIDGVVVTFTDITDRRALAEDRFRIAAIVESAEAGIIGNTLDGTIISWNRGAEVLYGYSTAEAIGRSIDFLVPPDHRDQIEYARDRVHQGEIVALETLLLTRKGRPVPISLSISPVHDATSGDLVGSSWIGRDVSAQREAEAGACQSTDRLQVQLASQTDGLRAANERLVQEVEERRRSEEVRRLLLKRVMTIENDERRRISRELHDQIGQQLAALTLRLKTLEQALPRSAELTAAQHLVNDVGRQVRDLAIEMRPTALDELGLLPVVSSYAEEWSQRHGVEVDYHTSGFDQIRLPGPLEEAIYRIVLEALTNVWKHAQAKRVSLILERHDNEVRAIVEDDGVGFDPRSIRTPHGRRSLGVIGMEERAGMVDGTLTLESQPGGGTTVFLRVPIPPPGGVG